MVQVRLTLIPQGPKIFAPWHVDSARRNVNQTVVPKTPKLNVWSSDRWQDMRVNLHYYHLRPSFQALRNLFPQIKMWHVGRNLPQTLLQPANTRYHPLAVTPDTTRFSQQTRHGFLQAILLLRPNDQVDYLASAQPWLPRRQNEEQALWMHDTSHPQTSPHEDQHTRPNDIGKLHMAGWLQSILHQCDVRARLDGPCMANMTGRESLNLIQKFFTMLFTQVLECRASPHAMEEPIFLRTKGTWIGLIPSILTMIFTMISVHGSIQGTLQVHPISINELLQDSSGFSKINLVKMTKALPMRHFTGY